MRRKQNYTATVLCVSLILATGLKASSYAATKISSWRDATLTKELNDLFNDVKPTKKRKPNEPIIWGELSRAELEELTYAAMKDAAACSDSTQIAMNILKERPNDCKTALDVLDYDGFRLKKH